MTNVSRIRYRLAEVNGAGLYPEILGGGEPLVLLHAGIADGRTWRGQLAAFGRRGWVVRYDMMGSAALPNKVRPAGFNRIVMAFLEKSRCSAG